MNDESPSIFFEKAERFRRLALGLDQRTRAALEELAHEFEAKGRALMAAKQQAIGFGQDDIPAVDAANANADSKNEDETG